MSLKQSLMNPAKKHFPDCWHREHDRRCLRIDLDAGRAFLFPYQQFLGVHHVRSTNPETLTITFSTHLVVLKGRNLSDITLALEDLAIAWIKPVPSRYKGVAEVDGPLVTDIEVSSIE